jgi:hypothetical protein
MIFLIVDGHPAHKAKKVKHFIESIADQFRLYFLPPYHRTSTPPSGPGTTSRITRSVSSRSRARPT